MKRMSFEMGVAPEVGIGCHECGHTGKRRVEMWVPAIDRLTEDGE